MIVSIELVNTLHLRLGYDHFNVCFLSIFDFCTFEGAALGKTLNALFLSSKHVIRSGFLMEISGDKIEEILSWR